MKDDSKGHVVLGYQHLDAFKDKGADSKQPSEGTTVELDRLRAENAKLQHKMLELVRENVRLVDERNEHRDANCAPFDAAELRAENARQAETITRLREAMTGGKAYVVTDYWNSDWSHRPYRAMLHDGKTDEPQEKLDIVADALARAGAHDGDEVRIYAIKTGERPFGDRRFRLVKPHTYEREPELREALKEGT